MTTPRAREGDGRRSVVRAFDRAAGSREIPGNRAVLLVDGPATYDIMLQQIAGARRRVHLENYIIHADAVGHRFADLLMAKARDGVIVRVLYDWLGSFGTSSRFWRELQAAGVQVRGFGPPRLTDPLLVVARDHRKVLVVDGERGVAGGLCIGDEWVGDPARGRQPWRDTALAVEGPAARALDLAFSRSWSFAGGTPPDDEAEVAADLPSAGDINLRVVATEPGRERAGRAIDLMVAMSAERLWVTEAYLSASQRLYQAFIDAARDGCDVRLLLPSSSDIRLVRNISRVGYRGLLRAGVRIWEWNGPMLHAKTIVADGEWLRVGSSNLNASSLLANWELDILVHDPALARAAEHQFLHDLGRSSEITLLPRRLPAVLRAPVPARFERNPPAEENPAVHVQTLGERRRRAMVRVSGLIQGARAALFGPAAAGFLVIGGMFAIFPVPMALAAAVIAALAAIALIVRALGHRERG